MSGDVNKLREGEKESWFGWGGKMKMNYMATLAVAATCRVLRQLLKIIIKYLPWLSSETKAKLLNI